VTDGRKRYARVLTTLTLTTLGTSVLVASPAHAEPHVHRAETRVDRLAHRAEQVAGRYHHARVRVKQARTHLVTVRSKVRRERAEIQAARRKVAAAVVAQYQGEVLTSIAEVLLSDDEQRLTEELTAARKRRHAGAVTADFALQTPWPDARQAVASRTLERVSRTKRQLAAEKAQLDRETLAAKELVVTLRKRAAARASRSAARTAATTRSTASAGSSSPSPSSTPAATPAPASGGAAAAVRYALAQVGDAYVYGAAGPSAFDCSGLTMAAWAQAGVSLPHSSSAQMGSGTPVSQSQLQPGDLVFYYSPVSHVGMYIGNGQIVNAENPSVGVKITGVNSMPYAGAVRPR
jgi:cell wall-associated NlpC family hydrolase